MEVVHNAPVYDGDPLPCCWRDHDNLPDGHRTTRHVPWATCRGPADRPDTTGPAADAE